MQPEIIKDQPLPVIGSSSGSSSNSVNGSSPSLDSVDGTQPSTIPDSAIPTAFIADDVVTSSLNTQSRQILGTFTFGQIGAIQIGNYSSGISGQINISPNGIVAKDSGGNTTFTLDGITGSATFKGTIAAGSVITGYLQVGGAAADVNGNSTTISGGKITTGSVTATQIAAGTITATQIASSTITSNKLNVSSLSAIAADMGTLTAGTINGGSITGSSQISVGGVALVGSGIAMNNNTLIGFKNTGGSLNMAVYADNSNNFIINNSSGAIFLLPGNGGKVELGNNINMNGYNIDGGNTIFLNGHALTNGNSSGHIKMDGTDKTAIVETSKGFNALYCIESPEVWFFDFIDPKEGIDPLFLEVTEGETKSLITEQGERLMFRRRKGHADKRFEIKTLEEFERNEHFLQMAK